MQFSEISALQARVAGTQVTPRPTVSEAIMGSLRCHVNRTFNLCCTYESVPFFSKAKASSCLVFEKARSLSQVPLTNGERIAHEKRLCDTGCRTLTLVCLLHRVITNSQWQNEVSFMDITLEKVKRRWFKIDSQETSVKLSQRLSTRLIWSCRERRCEARFDCSPLDGPKMAKIVI